MWFKECQNEHGRSYTRELRLPASFQLQVYEHSRNGATYEENIESRPDSPIGVQSMFQRLKKSRSLSIGMNASETLDGGGYMVEEWRSRNVLGTLQAELWVILLASRIMDRNQTGSLTSLFLLESRLQKVRIWRKAVCKLGGMPETPKR